jgi:hypothetical protein
VEDADHGGRSVTVTASELPKTASSLANAVHAAASRCGGRQISVVTSADEATLTVDFLVDAADDDAARDVGRSVLGAVESESFVWSVTVLTPSSG